MYFCITVYGLEACPLNKLQLASLDFVINRFFMKLFNTNSMETVKACQEYFSFELPSIQLEKKLSYCWETVRRESMPRIAEMDVEMTT